MACNLSGNNDAHLLRADVVCFGEWRLFHLSCEIFAVTALLINVQDINVGLRSYL